MPKTAGRPSTIQSLLTAAEKKVHDGTLGESLAAATRQQLEAGRKQARALRDKWRDLFSRQTIATKRKPAAADQANSRSLEKSNLFGEALKRIKTRLTELAQGIAATVNGTTRGAKAGRTGAARAMTKPTRQAGHRATRATIRGELSAAVVKINEATQKLVGKAGGTKKPAKPAAANRVVVKAGPRDTRASRKPVTSKKARQAGTLRSLTATGTGQALSFDVKKQRSAKARATATRLKVDGEATRRKGFVVSNTKRKQARRDSR